VDGKKEWLFINWVAKVGSIFSSKKSFILEFIKID
jgi:hypothetical protein